MFFAHWLYGEVNATLKHSGDAVQWRTNAIATMYVIAIVIGYFAELLIFLTGFEPELPAGALLSIGASVGVLLISGYLLLTAQQAINHASNDVDGEQNRRLTGANWLWIALGGVAWAIVLLSAFVLAMLLSGRNIM